MCCHSLGLVAAAQGESDVGLAPIDRGCEHCRPKAFRSGRDFSASIGLILKQNSSGGKDKLGNISKRGDRYLRSLFTAGALAVIRYVKIHGTKHGQRKGARPGFQN